MSAARLAAVAITCAVGACGKGGGGGGGGQRYALDPLGVTIELPAGSVVDTEDASDTWVDVMVPGRGDLKVSRADDLDLAAEREHQASYGITDFATKDFPGGTEITYSTRETGATYYVHDVVITVDGRKFRCGFSGSDGSDKAAMSWFVAPCKTLRKK